MRALHLSSHLDFVAALNAAKQNKKILVLQFYEKWEANSLNSTPTPANREFLAIATNSSFRFAEIPETRLRRILRKTQKHQPFAHVFLRFSQVVQFWPDVWSCNCC